MPFKRWLGCLLLALAGMAGARAEAEPRIALVIGNAHYSPEMVALTNPANDARLMADTLKKLGFNVTTVLDADQKQMRRAITDFGKKLADAGPTATGLFFYTGHGVSVRSESYMIPIDADISRESDVEIEALQLHDVVQQMEYAGVGTGIVIVDASRNNPLSRSFRSDRGLTALATTLPNYLFAYSTAPGSVARDGKEEHSPFVAALSETMLVPGLSIHEVFDNTRKKVLALTEDRQVPSESASMTDPFFFIPDN